MAPFESIPKQQLAFPLLLVERFDIWDDARDPGVRLGLSVRSPILTGQNVLMSQERTLHRGASMNESHLLLVGDVMLGRMVDAVLGRSAPSYPWGDTIDILGSADWRCCNLECVISDSRRALGAGVQGLPFSFRFEEPRGA